MGEESRPVILNNDNYGSSILSIQINEAITLVKRILKENTTVKEKENKNGIFQNVYGNQIISFIGDRGTGKTSCMYSVMNIISKSPNSEYKKIDVLKTIDPSFFDDNHNILELIIGNIYSKYELYRESINGISAKDYDKLGKLRRLFQEVKNDLRFLENTSFSEDSEIEDLIGLSAGLSLSEVIRKLVKAYLDCIGKEFLIISIDDMDLNTSHAYEMAEQVRKYLIFPEVIVFISCNIEQLSDAIKQTNINGYRMLMDKGLMTADDITKMTEAYLTKLLPIGNRIFMPTIYDYANTGLLINNDEKYPSVKSAVLELIYKKTHLLFYNKKGQVSQIIPTKLRDIRSLIGLLLEMRNYDDIQDSGERMSNMERFLNYFYMVWRDPLNSEGSDIVYSLLQIREPSSINHFVIKWLNKRYKLDGIDEIINKEIKAVLKDSCRSYNISLGDVMLIMKYIDDTHTDFETKRLLFFIKTFYTIQLNLYYNELKYNGEPKNENIDGPSFNFNMFSGISKFQQLLGGSYFTISGNTFIRASRNEGNREKGFLDGAMVSLLIKSLLDDTRNNEKWKDDEKIVNKLNLVEFLALISSYYFLTKTAIDKQKDLNSIKEETGFAFRERPYIYYSYKLGDKKNIRYDVTAPFFNVLNIKLAYDRFDDRLFGISSECDKSLYKKILKVCKDQIGKDIQRDDNYVLSTAAIRNIEVYDELYNYLYSKRTDTDGPDLNKHVEEFYGRIAKFSIPTYDKDKENKQRTTKLVQFEVLSDYLNENAEWEKYILRKDAPVDEFPFIGNEKMTKEEVWNAIPQNMKLDGTRDAFDEIFKLRGNNKYRRKTIIKNLRTMKNGGTLDGNA